MTRWLLLILLLLPGLAQAAETVMHNAATANADGQNISVADKGAVGITVTISGTATVTFKGSADGGSTWTAMNCTALGSSTNVTSTTSSGQYQCSAGGLTHVQTPLSGCSGCTVTVEANSSLASLGSGASSGGGTQYAEDAAHSSGDTGTMALGVRRDANTTLAGTDGDYTPFQVDANGNLKVNVIAGAGSGGTAMTDDAAFTPATTSITPAGAVFDDTAPDSVDEGDGGAVRMSANRNLYTTLRDAAGNERGANINASNELLTNANTELPAAAALADNTANPTVPGVAAFLMCYDGSTWDRCQGGLTDTDDGTIAGSQVPSLVINLGYVHDGTNWVRQRLTVGIEDAGETAGGALNMAGSVRRDVAASSAGTSGDNATINTDANGLLWARDADPCSALAKTYLPISISTATTTEITPSLAGASTHYYICSLNLVTAGANNVLVADDDTDGCASPTSGIFGSDGTPAAGEGWNFAANGGIVLGTGVSSVGRTGGTNRVICILTSAATQLSGMLIVVAAP